MKNTSDATAPFAAATGSTFRVRVTGSATTEEIVLGACVLLRAGELTGPEIWRIEQAIADAKVRQPDKPPKIENSKCEWRPGIGLCDCCGEPKWPQEDMGYGVMLCLDCIDHKRHSAND